MNVGSVSWEVILWIMGGFGMSAILALVVCKINIAAKWTAIDNLGKMRLSKNSYYWVILLPIIVSLVPTNITDDLSFRVFGETLNFSIHLPFKWYILFLVGLFFGLATLVYEWKCPSFIKTFRSYSQYKGSGYPHSYLMQQAELYSLNENEKIKNYNHTEPVEAYRDILHKIAEVNNDGIAQYGHMYKADYSAPNFDFQKQTTIYEKDRQDAFDVIFNKTQIHYPFWRSLCTIWYAKGTLLLSYLILKNVYFVFDHFIK